MSVPRCRADPAVSSTPRKKAQWSVGPGANYRSGMSVALGDATVPETGPVIGSRSFSSAPAGYRFPREVIAVAVRWYLRYGLSYRDVEELLAERGIEVDHVTVYRWVHRFTPLFAEAARFARYSPGDRWFVDETYVKVNGAWRRSYRRQVVESRFLRSARRV
jgi:hypothetical protein